MEDEEKSKKGAKNEAQIQAKCSARRIRPDYERRTS